MKSYYAPQGGLPLQNPRLPSRAIFTEAYVYIPREVMTDIVTSELPHWQKTRAWIIARPLSGFAETFAQYLVEVGAGGGCDRPEPDARAQAVLFMLKGELDLIVDGQHHALTAGHYAYVPAGANWSVKNKSGDLASFSWIRKHYQAVDGIQAPELLILHDNDVAATPMQNTDKWATTRFVDPSDLRHDMHLNIVTFQPGGIIPFDETHVMEHGIYMLQGTAVYRVNNDDIEVQAGDFLWLRAFCPQSCVATGEEPFRYLLYKDVNRHPSLSPYPAAP